MDDDAGPRSLFALVHYYVPRTPYYSILQLDRVEDQVDEKVRFNLPHKPEALRLMNWLFCPPNSSTEELYMVPIWEYIPALPVEPFHGCKFNIRTGKFLPINLPNSYSKCGSVVNLGQHIYYISRYIVYERVPVVIQRYDPVKNTWKALEPFPHFPAYDEDGHYKNVYYKNAYSGSIAARIEATAVWGDTILLNVYFSEVKSCWASSIWAYDARENKWHRVDVDNDLCKLIVGKAVVIGNSIYALTDMHVLQFSIKKKRIDDGFVFQCSLLRCEYIKPILCQQLLRTRHLVHLGKDKLCVVQSVAHGDDCQPIQLTYINIKRDNLAIVMDYFHQVKIQHTGSFMVELCFSLPKDALKEGKFFDLDPYNEDFEGREIVTLHKDRLHATSQWFQDNDLSERNFIDEEEADRSSIYVSKLPHNATVGQVSKDLRKFGPIKSKGIRFGEDEEGNLVARVEFESVSAKKCAIEESTIRIGGCLAEIMEERPTCLTLDLADRNTSSR